MTSLGTEPPATVTVEQRAQALRDRLLPPEASGEVTICLNGADVSRLIRQMSTRAGAIGFAVLPRAERSGIGRLVSWAGLVRRTLFAAAAVRRAGLRVDTRLGVFPSIEAPRIIFELDGGAGQYTEAELLPDPIHGTSAIVRRALRNLAGISPSIGAVVIAISVP